ncbi:MAG: SGNH/GDSL hydrolase family protein, partial [Planctomycetaceae bacterium]|nr:SGNH/GDSL hydrolase family protein [Planctomycetaceae bacterium]
AKKKIQPASLDATSVFDDHESKENELQSREKRPVNSDRTVSTGSVSAQHSTGNSLKKYLDNSPTVTTQGMQKIRGWLHDQQPRVWMFLGDETTAWLRHSGQPGFAEMFRHRLRWELRRLPDLIVNAGVQNASINELWKIGQQGLMQCRPDVAFILPGKSDCIQASKEPHRYAEKLKELAEFLRQNGTEPVFQTPPLINSRIDSNDDASLALLCDLIREVAVVNHIPLIDHAEFWQEQAIQKDWIDSPKHTITQAGQSVLALLFFAELDIFDRSSELCGKLQNAWSDSPSGQPVNHPQNILQS